MEISLRNLSLPLRVLFSSFLLMIGIGYLAALTYLFLVDVEPHAAKGQGLIEGIAEKYHGAPTRLETALRGPMADKIDFAGRARIFAWLRDGAKADTYESVKPLIDAACISCHSATSGIKRKNGDPVPSFETYEKLSDMAEINTGPSIAHLARVSHVHLFGISFLFFLTGFIFSMSSTPSWFRVLVIATPYAAIFADIGAWWLTKWEAFFAWVVVGGGALMGLALAGQILIPLWEMWLANRTKTA
jgi:hypothetical protein